MFFNCDYCGFNNNEIQFVGIFQFKGVYYEFWLRDMEDFQCQVVKFDIVIVKFIEFDVEVFVGKGQFMNVEGFLIIIVDDFVFD